MAKSNIYRSLGLSDEEYKKILGILNREPTTTELAMFSVEWSEHCGYPRSRNMLKILPRKGRYQVLVGEDSGGIIVDDMAIVFKMESHNHPSQVEPKQGAATGVGGIIRDIFTAGARPIACLDSLRFGPLSESYNRYLLRGVVDGIQFYGNCVGIPTIGGEIYFDECYSGNCLVNAMCIGIAKKDELIRARATGIGNSIIYVGSSTGRDGIGGCSILASKEFKRGEEKRPTVQIGDPFTEKCLIEATLEALATGHIIGIKDMGAAGLTCSSSEMAAAGDSGIEIDIDNVPRREEGMEPWEVMMSESQERMLACVKKGKEKQILDIFRRWDLNAEIIGHVIDEKVIRIKDKGKVVADIHAQALTNAPVYDMPYEKPDYIEQANRLDIKCLSKPADLGRVLLKLLESGSIANKHWIYQQYDHMVGVNTSVLPGSDAAVLRIKGTKKAIAATTDCNSRYCYLNPNIGAKIAVCEAARNLACTGAEAAAVTDCLNFGNPEKPDRYWHFRNCVEGLAQACQFLDIPVVSGNVSFYNESPDAAIYPTPTIGMIGIIEDVDKVCTQYFKEKGDMIVLLGKNKDEIGASEYLKQLHNSVAGQPPSLDLDTERSLHRAVIELIRKGLISSAHDCSEGGIAVCVAESCISGKELIGAEINLEDSIRDDILLFGESQSRIVISCEKENLSRVEEIARKNSVPLAVIGKTCRGSLKIQSSGKILVDIPVEKIKDIWYNSIEKKIT